MSSLPDLPDPSDLEPPPLDEALAADAVVAHASEPAGHGAPLHTHCENCGTKLAGPYCHRCGQHDFDVHRSFGHTFLEVLENFFHFDTKLFQSVAILIFMPGRLTQAFNAGKRAAQMPPFRLYIFVSILFFFLTFLGQDRLAPNIHGPAGAAPEVTIDSAQVEKALTDAGKTPEEAAEAKRAVDQIRAVADAWRSDRVKAVEASEAGKKEKPKSAFVHRIEERLHRLQEPEVQTHMLESFLHAIPKLVLVCMPLFALYTRFLFRKSGQVYLQHLVVALHFHTFVLLWVLVRNGWGFLGHFIGIEGAIHFAANLWLVVYPFLMLKYLFRNGWPRTILKTALLACAYTFTLSLAFLATAAAIVAVL